MDYFSHRDGQLYAEDVALSAIAAAVGTPCYVYSRQTLERHWRVFDDALAGIDHLVCYAVKANSNIAILNLLARLGSGFDIVSGGELARVLKAGAEPSRIVFSGVGKSADEMRRALEAGIGCFNVESEQELQRLDRIAGELGVQAPVSLRVNPDVDAGSHPYISTGLRENKFGIEIGTATALYREAAAMTNIRVLGVDCHIGSQLLELSPFCDALDRVLHLVDTLQAEGIALEHLDMGGGLGIRYHDETPPLPHDYVQALRERLGDRSLKILLEPGRAISGNAGVLLTRVEYLKHTAEKNFAIVDAAMNDLLRPALYDAWHDIEPLAPRPGETTVYDIVGPVCETGDFLGKARPLNLAQDDLLAIRSAGAYGAVMSSNYNSRPRAAEVLVDGDRYHVIRQRETLDDLMAGEHIPAP